jgi:hypothetical protein
MTCGFRTSSCKNIHTYVYACLNFFPIAQRHSHPLPVLLSDCRQPSEMYGFLNPKNLVLCIRNTQIFPILWYFLILFWWLCYIDSITLLSLWTALGALMYQEEDRHWLRNASRTTASREGSARARGAEAVNTHCQPSSRTEKQHMSPPF